MKIFDCIVESNNDPLKIGRIQVRIVGKHSENRTDSTKNDYLPITDLPWAIYFYNTGFDVPNKGDVGKCVFVNEEEQEVILLGITKKIVQTLPDFTKGFSDPDSTNPSSDQLGESQLSRLARNENIIDTIIQTKKDEIEENVGTADVTFSEPETTYDSVYPNNKVFETKGGHVIEIDDTTGKERIHIYHKSGTFIEFFPDGDVVTKIKKDNYDIIVGDDNIYVKSNENKRVDGDKNTSVVGSLKLVIGGNCDIETTGDATISAATVTLDSTTLTEIKSTGPLSVSGSTITIASSGALTLTGTPISLG